MKILPALRSVLFACTLLALVGPGASTSRAGEPAPDAGAYLVTSEAGAWRVTGRDLAARGLGAAAGVEVRRAGRTVPTRTDGEDLVVLVDRPAGPHSRAGLYTLHRRAGEAPSAPLQTGAAPAAPGRARALATLDADRFHGDLAAGPAAVYGPADVPTWFLAPLDTLQTATLEADGLRLPAVGPGALTVRVYATHAGPVRLRAVLDTTGLGTAEVAHAVGGATLTFEVPAAALREARKLEIVDESPPLSPPARDDVTATYGRLWIDRVDVDADVEAVAPRGAAPAVLLARPGLVVPPAPEGTAGHAALVRADGAVGAAFAWPAPPGTRLADALPPGSRLLLFAGERPAPALQAAPTYGDPVAACRGAAHVIVATPPLLPAAERLAAHRTAQGLSSVVVPSGAVWWVFGHGEASPAALRTFLVRLMEAPDSALRYVVLAGDATYDRVDLSDIATIPTAMARTKYNGATSSDRLYGRPTDGSDVGGVSVGRLPFRDPARLDAFVERLIRYETAPGPAPTRRLLRFITSEGRFGALIDGMLEMAFRQVIAREIPAAYDLEVTYANPRSVYLWPPRRFADKVVADLSEGALFLTYVGHGYEKGFDQLRVGRQRFPILGLEDVERVAVRGTPPVVLVLACTTAMFDGLRGPGVDEALLARPAGPIACWGASRICHPAANTLLGIEMATSLGQARPGTRLGDLLDSARDRAVAGTGSGQLVRAAMSILATQGYDLDPDRLALEASWMYTLLGDPATRLAVPAADVDVQVRAREDGTLEVFVQAPAADGARVQVARMRSRDTVPTVERIEGDLTAEENAAALIARHRAVNDLSLERVEGVLAGRRATLHLKGPAQAGEVIQVVVTDAADVHHGAVPVDTSLEPADRTTAPAGAR